MYSFKKKKCFDIKAVRDTSLSLLICHLWFETLNSKDKMSCGISNLESFLTQIINLLSRNLYHLKKKFISFR